MMSDLNLSLNRKFIIMENIQAIKPGPKPKKEDGSDDRRRRVDPPTEPKHPGLKPHIHKPGEKR
jgi:hypothetical protein